MIYYVSDFEANTTEVVVGGRTTQSVFGWIVVMSRTGTSSAWLAYRWNGFKNGFRISDTDFWLGLENMHQITATDKCRLRIEFIRSLNGGPDQWRSVEFWSVVIDNETAKYRLTVQG